MASRKTTADTATGARADTQVEFATKIAHDAKSRAAFLADPEGFARKSKVTLDPQFSSTLKKELIRVDKEIATFENKFGKIGGKVGGGIVVMNAAAVAAGAAVVSAAAAVVSAAVAVYNTTKFKSPALDKSIAAGKLANKVGGKVR